LIEKSSCKILVFQRLALKTQGHDKITYKVQIEKPTPPNLKPPAVAGKTYRQFPEAKIKAAAFPSSLRKMHPIRVLPKKQAGRLRSPHPNCSQRAPPISQGWAGLIQKGPRIQNHTLSCFATGSEAATTPLARPPPLQQL